MKCTCAHCFENITHVGTLTNYHKVNWHFSVVVIKPIFLHFSVLSGASALSLWAWRCVDSDIAWDNVLAKKSWKLDLIAWQMNLHIANNQILAFVWWLFVQDIQNSLFFICFHFTKLKSVLFLCIISDWNLNIEQSDYAACFFLFSCVSPLNIHVPNIVLCVILTVFQPISSQFTFEVRVTAINHKSQ